MNDMHSRNPTFGSDYGPPTEVQARLTGTNQTGHLVVIGNPISYIVEPGRYYPFLSMRGHTDPMSQAVGEKLMLQGMQGYELPSNQEPKRVTPGFSRSLSRQSTDGAAPSNPLGRLANTTLRGTGPLDLPNPQPSDSPEFFSGIPHSLGLEGI